MSKKVKDLEVLSTSIVFKEKEVLNRYRDQLEEEDLERHPGTYEKKGLLDSSRSDDSDEEEEKGYISKNTQNDTSKQQNYNKIGFLSEDEDDESTNYTINL